MQTWNCTDHSLIVSPRLASASAPTQPAGCPGVERMLGALFARRRDAAASAMPGAGATASAAAGRRPRGPSKPKAVQRPSVQEPRGAKQRQGARESGGAAVGAARAVAAGPDGETAAEHRRRHPTLRTDCPRCVFSALRARWELSYGSYRRNTGNKQECTVWLKERPSHLGGAWGIGCQFCAAYTLAAPKPSQGVEELKHKRGAFGTCGSWARFAVRSLSQVHHRGIRQHSETHTHKLATRWFFAPSAKILSIGSPGVWESDRELFRGGVPQVADWLEAWRACRTPVSFQTAEQFGVTANFIHGSRDSVGTSRKAFRSMCEVMALAIRASKRQAMEAAEAIGLALDDRQDFRLIRYKCSDTAAGTTVGASGCLGVLRRGGVANKELEDMSEDYSDAMKESVVRAFEKVCTSPGGVVDRELLQKLLAKVRVGNADGGAPVQKCLKLLASGPMPRLYCVSRDLAHAIRVATREPLVREQAFLQWYQDVFDKQHALVPDIRNSDAWSEKLLLCQQKVLGSQGVQGGGMKGVARVLSFAKQRFESCATPQRHVCCLYLAIAMVLAYQAADLRNGQDLRDRASAALQNMPKYVVPTGLAATYSAECLDFIRIFDTADHDPARTWREYQGWRARMTTLFLHAHALAALEEEGAGQGVRASEEPGQGSEAPAMTPLHIILRQAREAKPIWYGNRSVLLWREPPRNELKELVAGMQRVVALMLERLDVEFDINCPEIAFTALDLARWKDAFAESRQGQHDKKDSLLRHAQIMFAHWKLCGRRGVRELEACALVLTRKADIADNRAAWRRIFDPKFAEQITSHGRLEVVPPLLHIYLCALDGTGQVERDLGRLSQVVGVHSGPLEGEAASWLTEVRLDGPRDESGLGVRLDERESLTGAAIVDSGAVLQPTDFTRRCAGLWVALHGRRFRVYARRPTGSGSQGVPAKPPRVGTMARVAHDCRRARDVLAARAAHAPAPGADKTVFNLPRATFLVRGLAGQQLTPALRKFAKHTECKRKARRQLAQVRDQTRKRRQNPYAVGDGNPAKKLRRGPKVSGPHAAPAGESGCQGVVPPAGRTIRVLDCSGTPAASGSQGVVVARGHADNLFASIPKADIVLLDSPWLLDRHSAPSKSFLKTYFLVVALGAVVLPRADWDRPEPLRSPHLLRFSSLARTQHISIHLAAQFRSAHPQLTSLIVKCTGVPGSKWDIAQAGRPPAEAEVRVPGHRAKAKAKAKARSCLAAAVAHRPREAKFGSEADVRAFLLEHRTFARAEDFRCPYVRKRCV